MNKKYKWVELSDQGLMVKPKELGPYYDKEDFNGHYGHFDSEAGAIEHAEKVRRNHPYSENELVLVTVYVFSA
jgi:hypothetical protein